MGCSSPYMHFFVLVRVVFSICMDGLPWRISTKALYERYKAFVRMLQGPCSDSTRPL